MEVSIFNIDFAKIHFLQNSSFLRPKKHSGPHKGPMGPYKGPIGPYKGPMGPYKGPMGQQKKVFWGRWTFLRVCGCVFLRKNDEFCKQCILVKSVLEMLPPSA